jgi:hypothetical protein
MEVVRRDDRPFVGPAGGHPEQRRQHERSDVNHQHRRLHVERGFGAAARLHLAARARGAPLEDDRHARAHGALRRHGPVLQLVRPPHRREAHLLAAAPGGRDVPPLPVLGRQRLACRRAQDRGPLGAATFRARTRALRGDGFRLLLRARAQPGAVPLPSRRSGRFAVLLRHGRQREPDRRLHRDRPRAAATEGVLRALAHIPGHLRLLLPGDEAGRGLAPVLRRGRLRGRLPVQRQPARAVVGRLDVRGADARAVRAGGDLGPPELGREPSAGLSRPAREARPAAVGVHERGRDAARGLPGATLRARGDQGEPPQARARLPGPLRSLGLPRQRQRRDGARLRRVPLTRPGHDHGRPGQRPRRRRAAPGLRRPRPRARAAACDRGRALHDLGAILPRHHL